MSFRLVSRLSVLSAISRSSIRPTLVKVEVVSMDLSGKLAIGRGHSGKAERMHLIEAWMCQHLGGFLSH